MKQSMNSNNTPKILLLGKNGQVGWELQRSLSPLGELYAFDRQTADLSDPQSIRKLILDLKPDFIVNAAAYTAVDKAEEEKELAFKINADAVKVIAEAAKEVNSWLIHYSTDYVYDGTKESNYIETDEVNPLSIYGQSKLAGEDAIRASGCQYLNFRTSWVFAAKGNNFAKSMIQLAKNREQLKIVADQFGAPTSAELIADVTALCICKIKQARQSFKENASGTYHLVSTGEASWYSYSQYVIDKAIEFGVKLKLTSDMVFPITTEEYPLPATRPANSKLSINKIEQKFDINLPHWKQYVDRMLAEISQ